MLKHKIILLGSCLLLFASIVYAGSATINDTTILPDYDQDIRSAYNSSNCASWSFTALVPADFFTLSVSVTGDYTVSASTTAYWVGPDLYYPDFALANCLYSYQWIPNGSAIWSLEAGKTYVLVIIATELLGGAGGDYRFDISGPGNICIDCPAASAGEEEVIESPAIVYPPDKRINWQYGDLHAVLYRGTDSEGNPAINVYCYDDETSWLGMQANSASTNGVNANGCHVTFYILPDGGYQFNINYDGKLYEIECADFECRPPALRYYDPNE